MDISIEKTKSVEPQPYPFVIALQAVRGVFDRLIRLFILSKDERSQAGIDLSGEGRDG